MGSDLQEVAEAEKAKFPQLAAAVAGGAEKEKKKEKVVHQCLAQQAFEERRVPDAVKQEVQARRL